MLAQSFTLLVMSAIETGPPDQCNLAGPRAAALQLCETSPAVPQVHAEGITSTRCSLPIPACSWVRCCSIWTSQINGHDLTSRAAWTQLIASVGNYSDQLLSCLQRETCASSGCAEDSAATAGGGATRCTRCTPGRSIHLIHDDAGRQPASTPTPRPLQLASKCVGLHTWWFELVHCAHASGEHTVSRNFAARSEGVAWFFNARDSRMHAATTPRPQVQASTIYALCIDKSQDELASLVGCQRDQDIGAPICTSV